ncbi:MAG: molecular chaperone TorD family protein [Anaerolineales bacterium]
MGILLISANPLFGEVIAEMLPGTLDSELCAFTPDQVATQIEQMQPEVLIVDEKIPGIQLERILSRARALPRARVLLLNAYSNDFVVLDTYRASIQKVEDLHHMIKSNKWVSEDQDYQRIDQAKARAGMFNFLAALYNRRPDRGLVHKLSVIPVDDFVNLPDEQAPPEVSQGLREMSEFIRRASGLEEEEIERRLAVDWTRLFRGVRPGYGPPPPYESVYLSNNNDVVRTLQSVVSKYSQAGATIEQSSANRPDYIGLELGFMGFLADQKAKAWQAGEIERGKNFAEISQTFMADHLGRWVQRFCNVAIEHARTEFYRGLLLLTKGVVG